MRHATLDARCLWTAGVVAAFLGCCIPASAANFSVDPTSLTFSKQIRDDVVSGDIVVRNVGSDTIRMSVHAYDWSQTPDEREHLIETDHVSYYPQQFTIEPNHSQRIRIGVTEQRAATERAYRLIISELPPPRFAAGTVPASLSFYTKVDLPIFLSPPGSAAPSGTVRHVTQTRHTLDILLANDGSAHVKPSTVSVSVRNRSGKVVWHDDTSAFYVLAQHEQGVHFQIPHDVCPSVGDAVVQWGMYSSQVTPLRADDCAR